MVSTRQHPSPFPPPELAPSLQNSTSSPSKPPSSPSKRGAKRTSPGVSGVAFVHTPSKIALLWLFVSLPLVIWDTGYVLMRPHTMPGGKFHSPIWTPYALYGTVDHIYGWPAYNANNGFTSAQGSLNLVETLGYLFYLNLVYSYGAQRVEGKSAVSRLLAGKELTGNTAAWAVLIMFGINLMTLSKTVLYWLNESFSGFNHIGHNDVSSLIFLWIVPNGLWLIFPTLLVYSYGKEIVDGLSGEQTKKIQ